MLRGIIEVSDLVDEYLQYSKSQEAPDLYHRAAIIWVISSVLGRRVWIHRGHYRCYPNLWFTLVSDAGEGRKSTATDSAAVILEGLLEELKETGMATEGQGLPLFYTGNITPEKFLENQDCPCPDPHDYEHGEEAQKPACMYIDDMQAFFARFERASALTDIMLPLWSSKASWANETKTRGCDYLYNTYLTFISNTTRDWIENGLGQRLMQGGWVSRCIFLYHSGRTKRIAFPEDFADEVERRDLRARMVIKLRNLFLQARGPMVISPEAKELFGPWYNQGPSQDEKRAAGTGVSWYNRYNDHALRIAMCLSLSRGLSMEVTAEDMRKGIDMMMLCSSQLPMVFGRLRTGDEDPYSHRFMHTLREHSPIYESEFKKLLAVYTPQAKMYGQYEETKTMFKELGMLKSKRVKSEKKGRPPTILSWTGELSPNGKPSAPETDQIDQHIASSDPQKADSATAPEA